MLSFSAALPPTPPKCTLGTVEKPSMRKGASRWFHEV